MIVGIERTRCASVINYSYQLAVSDARLLFDVLFNTFSFDIRILYRRLKHMQFRELVQAALITVNDC